MNMRVVIQADKNGTRPQGGLVYQHSSQQQSLLMKRKKRDGEEEEKNKDREDKVGGIRDHHI